MACAAGRAELFEGERAHVMTRGVAAKMSAAGRHASKCRAMLKRRANPGRWPICRHRKSTRHHRRFNPLSACNVYGLAGGAHQHRKYMVQACAGGGSMRV